MSRPAMSFEVVENDEMRFCKSHKWTWFDSFAKIQIHFQKWRTTVAVIPKRNPPIREHDVTIETGIVEKSLAVAVDTHIAL